MKTKLLALLLSLVLCLGMMPLTAVAAEASNTEAPTDDRNNIIIPIKKIVNQDGSVTPPSEVFIFEAFLLGNESDPIEVGKIETTGEGEYTREFEFSLDNFGDEYINQFFLREKQGNADGWTYSDKVYQVSIEYREIADGLLLPFWVIFETEEGIVNIASVDVEGYIAIGEPIDLAEFENTYTNNDDGDDDFDYFDYYFQSRNTPADTTTDTNPNTGDATGTALWIVLAGMTLFGAAVAVFGRKLRRSK